MISDSGIQSSAAPVIDQELNAGDPGPGRGVLAPGVPLCVDLDGTLVKSDTLVDSVLALARQKPGEILRIPSWIAQGKAQFKKHVTAAVTLDVEQLPRFPQSALSQPEAQVAEQQLFQRSFSDANLCVVDRPFSQALVHHPAVTALGTQKPFFAVVLSNGFINNKIRTGESYETVTERDAPGKLVAFRDLVTSKLCKFVEDQKDIRLAIGQSLGEIEKRDDLAGWVSQRVAFAQCEY